MMNEDFTPVWYDAALVLAGPDKIKICAGNDIEWHDEVDLDTVPTDEEIKTKLAELTAAWEAKEYARNRKREYPDTGTQFNKIYDDGLTKWKSEMVDPVKTKWPKDNSGPVE